MIKTKLIHITITLLVICLIAGCQHKPLILNSGFLVDTFENSTNLDRESIRESLTGAHYHGITGKFYFNSQGSVIGQWKAFSIGNNNVKAES